MYLKDRPTARNWLATLVTESPQWYPIYKWVTGNNCHGC